MRVGIATDHGGFGLKEDLLARLRAAGHEVVDFGAHSLDPGDDYPDFVIPLARAVAEGKVERGVAVCGSGVGASVCANKIPGVRAGPGRRSLLGPARRRGRPHEHHLYGRPDRRAVPGMGPFEAFLGAEFGHAERYLRRLDKVAALEPETSDYRGVVATAKEPLGRA